MESGRQKETEAKKIVAPEQIVAKLRRIEVLISRGGTVPQTCKEAGIVEQTFYRWRQGIRGLQMEQARNLKDLQKENAQMRRAVADLTVEEQILKDIAQRNFGVPSGGNRRSARSEKKGLRRALPSGASAAWHATFISLLVARTEEAGDRLLPHVCSW